MFDKRLFDKICKENGVNMVESESPVLRIDGERVPLTKDIIEHVLMPAEASFFYRNSSDMRVAKWNYSYEMETNQYQMVG